MKQPKSRRPSAESEEQPETANSQAELSDDELDSVAGGFDPLGAQSFTQGGGVHLPGGADQHLPHEASHAIQQKTGGNG